MHKWLYFSAAVLLATLGTGCTTQPVTNTENDAGNPITLRFFSNLPDRDSGQGLLEQRDLDSYRANHPNINIQLELLQDEPYKLKLQTYMQSDNMPDIWMQWGQRAILNPIVKGGLALELNPADFTQYHFIAGSLNSFSVDGKLYGLPKNNDYWVLYYNQAILEQYGLDVPQTTDDLITDASKLRQYGLYCVSLGGKDSWNTIATLESLIFRKTGNLDAFKQALAAGSTASNPDYIAALNEFNRLRDAGVFQPSFGNDDYASSKSLFINGKSAMWLNGSWEMGMTSDMTIGADIRNNIRAASFPVVNGWDCGKATDLVMWFGGGYSVSAESLYKEEALELVKYLVSPEIYAKNAVQMRIVIPPMAYDQYITGSETPLQNDLMKILNSATPDAGELYDDMLTITFKYKSESLTRDFNDGLITPEEYLTQLDNYATNK
jgi:raffinose/stachyose/melibiose transport system substrate-binding protein